MAERARAKNGRFKKGGVSRRRRRRRNPEAAAAPEPNPRRRRRRRRRNPTSNPSPRRRANPSVGSGAGKVARFMGFPSGGQVVWGIAANLAMSFAVKRFGNEWGKGLFGDNVTSPYQGQAWDGRNYLIGALSVLIGARVVNRWQGAVAAKHYADAGWGALISRLTYTEIIGKSDWMQKTFGQVPGAAQIFDDGSGNRYLQTDNGWVAMQGYGYQPLGYQVPTGALVQASPMGYYEGHGALVQASPMGGPASYARDINRSDLEGNLAGHTGRKYANTAERERIALYNATWN